MTMEVALLGTNSDNPGFNNDARVKRLLQTEGQLLALQRIWDTGTLAYRTVTDADMGGGGGGGGDASAANQTTLNNLISASVATTRNKIKAATDYKRTFTWLDLGTNDARPDTIVHSSASLGLSVTDTFTWVGGSGFYVPDEITGS